MDENNNDYEIKFDDIRLFFQEHESLSTSELNQILKRLTGIVNFFKDLTERRNFLGILAESIQQSPLDLGDFQTPIKLTLKICETIKKNDPQFSPKYLIEPTCGQGNFILAALTTFPKLKKIYGIELQSTYEWQFKARLLSRAFFQPIHAHIEFVQANIFTYTLNPQLISEIRKNSGDLLLLGNPPWVTNTGLSKLESTNLPVKENYKKFRGIDSITGKSNFDLAESIIINLIQKINFYILPPTNNWLAKKVKCAFLCKNIVIRNILKEQNHQNNQLPITNIHAYEIDSKKWFKVAANASLLIADIQSTPIPVNFDGYENKDFQIDPTKSCLVHSDFDEKHENIKNYKTIGWIGTKFVSNMDNYHQTAHFEGRSTYIWRQGVKHDATKVMVFEIQNQNNSHPNNSVILKNGLNETVELEEQLIYPFLKGSDLKTLLIRETNRRLIITQHKVGEDTTNIESNYPKLWKYLNDHKDTLDNRKSVIYRNKPPFSIFGVGEYTFKPFKIGIAGFYKTIAFRFIPPINGKPVILDDTSYFLGFDTFEEALKIWAALQINFEQISAFFHSIVFLDTKRPWTKELLMRFDCNQLVNKLTLSQIEEIYKRDFSAKDQFLSS